MSIELLSREWETLANELRRECCELLVAANHKLLVTESGAADPNVLAATLLCRTRSHLEAVTLLLKSRLVVEARTIVRNALENAFLLAALAEPETRAETIRRMGEAHIYSRQRMGQFIMHLRSRLGAAVNEELQSEIRKLKGRTAKPGIRPNELAERGKFRSAYLQYQHHSDDAHPSLQSLARHITSVVEEGQSIRCIDVVAQPRSGDELTIQHACQAMLSALVAANEIWGANYPLRPLGEKYCSLAGLPSLGDLAQI